MSSIEVIANVGIELAIQHNLVWLLAFKDVESDSLADVVSCECNLTKYIGSNYRNGLV